MSAPPDSVIQSPSPEEIAAVKRKHALRGHEDAPSSAGTETAYIVEGIFPQRQLGVMIGPSGIGKSPLLYQVCLCAAAGIPCLGQPTVPSDVLYLDYENASGESRELEERISNFLGLPDVPKNFLRWNGDDCAANFGTSGHTVEDIIRDWSRATASTGRAKLVVIDPLRYWLTRIENPRFADEEIQRARRLVREAGVTPWGVHHVRRLPNDHPGIRPLEHDPRAWITAMSRGALALLNGSDVRLGLNEPESLALLEDVALVLGGFRRVRGQIGPIYIARSICDEDGEPAGYRRLASVELLGNTQQIETFRKLPARFTFTEAMAAYERTAKPTTDFLKKCEATGLTRREGRWYVKNDLE